MRHNISLHTEGQDPSPALLRGVPGTGTGCSPGAGGHTDRVGHWASLVAQALGIRLPVQGQGLILGPGPHTQSSEAHVPQLLSLSALELMVCNRRSHGDEKPRRREARHGNQRGPVCCGKDPVRPRETHGL